MKLSKGKIILIIIVIYFTVFAIININKEKDNNQKILEEVVYVTDGKVKEENEGKLVVVTGKISYDELVTFLELEDFGSIKMKRTVEDYVKEEDGYDWVEREEPLEDNKDNDYLKSIVSEEKISDIWVGEYHLDEKGLDLLPCDKRYYAQESIGDLTTTGLSYERDPWEENLEVGDIRLTYEYFELDKYPTISILAEQKDGSFTPYKIDKKTDIYQIFLGKVDTKEKLAKELQTNVKKTTKGKFLFIAMILGIGIFLIIDNKKTSKKA